MKLNVSSSLMQLEDLGLVVWFNFDRLQILRVGCTGGPYLITKVFQAIELKTKGFLFIWIPIVGPCARCRFQLYNIAEI